MEVDNDLRLPARRRCKMMYESRARGPPRLVSAKRLRSVLLVRHRHPASSMPPPKAAAPGPDSLLFCFSPGRRALLQGIDRHIDFRPSIGFLICPHRGPVAW